MRKVIFPLIAAILSFCACSFSAGTESAGAVHDFCVRHLGQQVGDGVCHTLVDEALRSAGLPAFRGQGTEIWRIASTPAGVTISGDYNKVLPGDIIYFSDIFPDRYRFRGDSDRPVLPEHPRANHVGVVDSISIDGVRYFDQNAGGQKIVRSDYFPFGGNIDLVGYISIVRP